MTLCLESDRRQRIHHEMLFSQQLALPGFSDKKSDDFKFSETALLTVMG